MSKSTFWTDGYNDGFNGYTCSPPATLVRADGESTDVYANEYKHGHQCGKDARESQARMNSDAHLMGIGWDRIFSMQRGKR